jgi:site-specific recombinase XerC
MLAENIIKLENLNVVPLNKSQLEVREVYYSFLKSNSRNSQRTAKEYESRVKEFFQMTIERDVSFISLEDIKKIKHSHVKMYVSDLTESGNSDKTISAKLYTVKSFYNEMLKNELQVNPTIFKVKLNIEEKHHEALSFDELESLYDFLMNSEKEMGFEKYLLLKTLFTTGNRRTATFNMTWDDSFLQKRDLNTGQTVWIVRVKDKGNKWNEKPIPDEFYEELQSLNKGQGKVFSLSTKTVERALERFSEQLGRNITMHSMKATGVTLGYQLTKDINLCKQYASHADISTTAIYLREEKSYVNQLSYNMSRKLDESKLLNMSHEELLNFIMKKDNADIKNSILLRLG